MKCGFFVTMLCFPLLRTGTIRPFCWFDLGNTVKIKQQKSTKGEQKGYDSMSLEDMRFMLGLIKSKKIKLDTQTTKKEK